MFFFSYILLVRLDSVGLYLIKIYQFLQVEICPAAFIVLLSKEKAG